MKADASGELTNALLDGTLRSTTAARFPLDQVAEAHELVEAGAPGRIIVEVASSRLT